MKNKNIARVLKEYRKSNALTVNQVSDLLKERSLYVAPKTIYGWESGQTQPDADMLMILCDIYQIQNVLGTFGYQDCDTDFHITNFEKEMILKFRQHPEMQDAVVKLLSMKS